MVQEINLTAAEVAALRAVARRSETKKHIPDKVRDRLIELGYIEQSLGELVTTAKGKLVLASHLPRRRRTWHPS